MRILWKLAGLAMGAAIAASPAAAQQPRDITVGLASRSLVNAPPRIAHEMGLFAKHGLNPKFVFLDSANAATGAIISRSVDIALSGLADVLAAQARGQKVVVIANSYVGLSGSLVLAKAVADKLGVKPDAPVADRLKALEGLVIASTSPTSSFTIAYGGAAKAVGATPRFTFMALATMGAALETGAIQGMVATAPFWALPILKGTGVLWLSAPKGELPAQNISATAANFQAMREFIDANPDVIRRFVAVNEEFTKAVEERPEEVKAIIAKLYPEIDKDTLNLLYSLESKAWRPKPITADDIKHEIEFVKSSGVQLPDVEKIDPASLLLAK